MEKTNKIIKSAIANCGKQGDKYDPLGTALLCFQISLKVLPAFTAETIKLLAEAIEQDQAQEKAQAQDKPKTTEQ